MTNTQPISLGKVFLACAISIAATNAAPIQVQTISASTDIVVEEILSLHGKTEVVVEQDAVDQQRRERTASLSRKFADLTKEWRNGRGAQSTVAQIALLPAYQGIIGIGPEAIPLILTQLKSEGDAPDHWFWALAAITRENPVPPESRGKVREMAKAWLDWGEKKGHV